MIGSAISIAGDMATNYAIVTLGDGDNKLVLKAETVLPSSAALMGGMGIDTLQLGAIAGNEPFTGAVNLSNATEFDALLIGPDNQGDAFIWLISTDAGTPANFADGITHQSGALFFDGTVELTGDFTQKREEVALDATQAPRMVFNLGDGPSDPTNDTLDLIGELTLEGPVGNREGASVEITFTDDIVALGTYRLITASDGIRGKFDSEALPDSSEFEIFTAMRSRAGSRRLPGRSRLVSPAWSRADSGSQRPWGPAGEQAWSASRPSRRTRRA